MTYSARRAVELLKALAPLQQPAAKLFAKHMKPEEQAAVLSKRAWPLAVGTPNRLLRLADEGALTLGDCRAVLVDVGRDAKSFHALDMPQVAADTARFLQRHVLEQARAGRTRLGLFE